MDKLESLGYEFANWNECDGRLVAIIRGNKRNVSGTGSTRQEAFIRAVLNVLAIPGKPRKELS